jgi:hypothetical protein
MNEVAVPTDEADLKALMVAGLDGDAAAQRAVPACSETAAEATSLLEREPTI